MTQSKACSTQDFGFTKNASIKLYVHLQVCVCVLSYTRMMCNSQID